MTNIMYLHFIVYVSFGCGGRNMFILSMYFFGIDGKFKF